jgi:acyl carrier protein
MGMADIDQEVVRIVARVAKTDQDKLGPETRLAEDLMVKSIGRIELAALIDAQFGTRTSNFEIRRPKTIQDLVNLVAGKL